MNVGCAGVGVDSVAVMVDGMKGRAALCPIYPIHSFIPGQFFLFPILVVVLVCWVDCVGEWDWRWTG